MAAVGQQARFSDLSASAYRGFYGGLNIRDAPDELAPGESPDLWNVVLDERGGFGARLGMARYNADPYHGTNLVSAIYEWHKGGHVVVQCGPSLYLDDDTTAFKTFTTSDRCGFAEFAGKLFIGHPVDGLFYSDGTSGGTVLSVTGPRCRTLAVWQNRLWAPDVSSARLYFSAIGTGDQWAPSQSTLNGAHTLPLATITVASTSGFDPAGALTVGTGATKDTVAYTGITATTFTGCTGGSHAWPTGTVVTQGANYNDLIEKDEQPVVCLKGASGQDVIGQPGLLAFKQHSAYRINDPDTGAYTTLDPEVGAASNAAAAVVAGRVYTISDAGICWTDGRGPMRVEADKLRPLWSDQQLAYDKPHLWCAGRRGQHAVFSVPLQGSTANDLAFEHYPAARADQASTVIGSNAASCYCTLTDDQEQVVSGSPTTAGRVYVNGSGGTDDGAAIRAWYQTAWLAPHPERLTRIRSAVIEGRGAFTLYVRFDYSLAQGDFYPVSLVRGGFTWNDFDWNDGSLWGPGAYALYADPIPSLGVCRVVSFRAEATTTGTTVGPGLAGAGTAPLVGGWGLYAIHLKTVPLRQL